jgi:integrase
MKREKKNFTVDTVAGFKCAPGIKQDIYWDRKTPGLGLRVTSTGSKAFIFETSLNNKTIRMTIGDPRNWPIGKAQAEASRLKVMTDQGIDPRQVIADAIAAKEAKETAQRKQEARESVTVAEAWQVYVAERSEAKIDGKPVWGDRHRECHNYFVQAGGVKRKSGRRTNEPKKTRAGVLVPLMTMRLADLDADAVAAWLDKETQKAPAIARLAFSLLRSFIAWCAKHETYSAAVHADACQSDFVKNKVPTPKTKKNDSLRKAQIKPWFEAVQKISNPVISAYLQGLLLTGARRNELAALRWQDVDFKWKSLTIRDKVEGERTIPLTPYLEHLISALPRRSLNARQIGDKANSLKRAKPNPYVFSSPTAASGRLEEPRTQHNKALDAAALPALSLHGLRRSFGTLSEWVEVPAGIVAQIMGHKPSAIAEKHYIQRELDLLHQWHVKIEAWMLKQAGIKFVPVQAGLRIVI